jgi:hypothetical protein
MVAKRKKPLPAFDKATFDALPMEKKLEYLTAFINALDTSIESKRVFKAPRLPRPKEPDSSSSN